MGGSRLSLLVIYLEFGRVSCENTEHLDPRRQWPEEEVIRDTAATATFWGCQQRRQWRRRNRQGSLYWYLLTGGGFRCAAAGAGAAAAATLAGVREGSSMGQGAGKAELGDAWKIVGLDAEGQKLHQGMLY